MMMVRKLKRRPLVLVVDDQEINRDLLGMILADEYEVAFAEHGEQALQILRERHQTVSLVLLDLMMPVMDGFEVLRQMREAPELARVPVIVLTADKSAELKALQMGAADFVTKPFDLPEVILARVARIVELAERREVILATERDPLTHLYTRSYFLEYVEQILASHPDYRMDAVVIDIERFHALNDLNGREYGDTVLRALAAAILEFLDSTDGIACRIEPDRFDIFCRHRDDYQAVLDHFEAKMTALSGRATVLLRMGVKPWREGVAPLVMFDRARVACNMLRGNAQTHLMVFDDEMHQREVYRQRLLNDLRPALEERQFIVYYQPKFNILCDPPRLSSSEALIRWKHPEFGMVSPGEFIPLFETHGCIHLIDDYVWKEAARQVAAWRDEFGVVVPASVNLSRSDLFDPTLRERLSQLVRDYDLEPRHLKLEVTESAYTDDPAQLAASLSALRALGFEIEMDDFGSGYSSLNMLSTLPIDVLKMDMKFIQNVGADKKSFRLVELIIDIARYLQVPVVAEGVETAEQISLLRSAGCKLVQGYYFSKPLPAEEFAKMIQKELVLEKETVS
ncbi:MAG: EAL domain-containing protein [Planctomycetes bacterium]|nr:EAL domain-containing protein [Planctomycetota bacterium]